MAAPRELLALEDRGWVELLDLIELLTLEQLEAPGYDARAGWSVKDLMAHIACWQALTVRVLEQIRCGTRTRESLDVDATNARFFELTHDLPLRVIKVVSWSARTCMLVAWADLPGDEVTDEAEEWFRESGPEHYREHLDRLREWVREVQARR